MRHKDYCYGSIGVYCIATTTRNDTETPGIIGLLKEMTPWLTRPSRLHCKTSPSRNPTPARGKGLFARVIDAMMVSRQRDAEREIARYIAGSGGKFTDETEREIERRFLSTASHW